MCWFIGGRWRHKERYYDSAPDDEFAGAYWQPLPAPPDPPEEP